MTISTEGMWVPLGLLARALQTPGWGLLQGPSWEKLSVERFVHVRKYSFQLTVKAQTCPSACLSPPSVQSAGRFPMLLKDRQPLPVASLCLCTCCSLFLECSCLHLTSTLGLWFISVKSLFNVFFPCQSINSVKGDRHYVCFDVGSLGAWYDAWHLVHAW